jgi:TRAP-type C4-dicarboxylate transport system permease small subunit
METAGSASESGFRKIDRAVVKTIRLISYGSGFCLVAIMLMAFFNVLGEKLFKHGIPTSTETVQYLHIPVVFLTAAYVTLDRGHTRIDLLSSRIPPGLQKACVLMGNLLGIFICSFISYRGLIQTGRFFARHRMSSVTGIGFPLWPCALLFSLGFALLSLSYLWNIIRQFAPVPFAGTEPDAAAGGREESGGL